MSSDNILIEWKLVKNILMELNPIKGRSLMAHIRRTRHIMMLRCRDCFSYSTFNS